MIKKLRQSVTFENLKTFWNYQPTSANFGALVLKMLRNKTQVATDEQKGRRSWPDDALDLSSLRIVHSWPSAAAGSWSPLDISPKVRTLQSFKIHADADHADAGSEVGRAGVR